MLKVINDRDAAISDAKISREQHENDLQQLQEATKGRRAAEEYSKENEVILSKVQEELREKHAELIKTRKENFDLNIEPPEKLHLSSLNARSLQVLRMMVDTHVSSIMNSICNYSESHKAHQFNNWNCLQATLYVSVAWGMELTKFSIFSFFI